MLLQGGGVYPPTGRIYIMYHAHTPNSAGNWHDLAAHLRETAQLARQFAQRFEAGELAYYAGLWHDLGKFHRDFQQYLQARAQGQNKKSHPHAVYGAVYASQHSLPLAFAIMGHHMGMPDKSELKSLLGRVNDLKIVEQSALQALPQIQPSAPPALPPWLNPNNPLQVEMLTRMVFSCLVDADFLDTERHFDPQRAALRMHVYAMRTLWQKFQQDQQALLQSAPNTPVNRVRREVYEHAIAAAEGERGLYELTAPTGAGKTRAALGFALKHGVIHNMERVIVALPYTSIIDQTADVYRAILGDDAVLEHHSALEVDDMDETALERLRLLSENWDAPLIVTTFVQLFESLFSNKPSRCRKLHRLVNSVIVLDEVQTLPVELLEPTIQALQQLIDDYGVTVLLCTATQPAIHCLKGVRNPTPILADPAPYFQQLRRVAYQIDPQPRDWDWLAEQIAAHERVMVVLNARADALELIDAVQERFPQMEGLYHLSTLLCPAHRRQVLSEIRQRLSAGEPCRLIATQVVEAGVDLDFPVVMRAVGPLDRIVQAAGRCNREGRLAQGKVIVFEPQNGRAPSGPYRTGMDEARITLRQPSADLHNPQTYTDYFKRLYQGVSLDRFDIQSARRSFLFCTVGCQYRLIREETLPVVVRTYEPAKVDSLLRKGLAIVRQNLPLPKQWHLNLRAYTVALYPREVESLKAQGLIREDPELGLLLYEGAYDPLKGIVSRHDPADLVV